MLGGGRMAQALQATAVGSGAAEMAAAGLPDAPVAQTTQASAAAPTEGPPQTKRILGLLPNFRSVNAGVTLPPETPKEKMTTALEDSFDYSAFVFVGVQAGAAMASASTPEFHQGAAGYARYYWHTFADQADENLQVEGLLPIVFHEDNRYYTRGHGHVARRAEYSVTRLLITRKDDGERTVNLSEIVGAGGAAGLSAIYYPGVDKTWTKVGQRWLTNLILDGGEFTFKEFWPDINSRVFHQKD